MDQIAAWVGIDWGGTTHFACILNSKGDVCAEHSFSHSGEGLHALDDWIRAQTALDPSNIVVGIEVPHGPVVDCLMDAGYLVHAINPLTLDRFRDRFTIAGSKNDKFDAMVIADALRTDRRFFQFVEARDPHAVELREWSRITEDLVTEQNRLSNQFRHQLWRYYPQFLKISCNWSEPWMLDLWELIPTPSKAKAIRPSRVAKFLAGTCVRKWNEKTLLTKLRSQPLCVADGVLDACLAHCRILIARLRLVQKQIKEARSHLKRLSALVCSNRQQNTSYHDGEILLSLPGIGTAVLASLLSEAGNAVSRRDASTLRSLAGVAPVTRRSGKQNKVTMRKSCPRRLRKAVYHWARIAVMNDQHCKDKYNELRAKGHGYARALRSIASRLIGVACAMLRNGELFNPERKPQLVSKNVAAQIH